MRVTPPTGPAQAKIFGLIVSGVGIVLGLGLISTLLYFSITNGQKVDALTPQYADAEKKATPSDAALAKTKVSKSAESTVSSFEDISAGMSGAAAAPAVSGKPASKGASAETSDDTSAKTGDGTTAAGSDGASAGDRPPLGGPTAESGGHGSPEKTETVTPATAAAPASTMPTLAQLARRSGQAAKVSEPADLADQAMRQAEQLTKMEQQDQEAAAPAEEAAVSGDVGAGAAVGTGAAERAPVEVAAVGAEPGTDGARRVI